MEYKRVRLADVVIKSSFLECLIDFRLLKNETHSNLKFIRNVKKFCIWSAKNIFMY